jgi:nucleotide-binding universal stress UspA family protein
MKVIEGFKSIVLATDGSEAARAAVDATIELASASDATVHVVDVWNLEVRHRHGASECEILGEAERIVRETVQRLAAEGIKADETVYRADGDHVAGAIAQLVRQHGADLVVIGSRGLSDWRSLFDHSVSHRVLASVDCPVLIVRTRPGPAVRPRRIMIAIAGGNDIEPTVRAAAAVAATSACNVSVVHVMQSIVAVEGFAYLETDEEAEASLDEAHRRLAAAGISAERVVIPSGPAARAIADAAQEWKADLIVTGSSRMGDAGSLLLGSVSHDLLHRTDIPVLIAARPS